METRKKLSGVQRLVARHMVQSVQTIPHVTTIREVRMDAVERVREEISETVGRVSVLSFVAYAAIKALMQFPILNASLDENEIVYHEEINLGVAVSVGEDLKVPVVTGSHKMDFLGVVDSLKEIRRKASENSFQPDDFRGGTFTLSNSGALGGEIFTPIINYPQSAILGLGRLKTKPIVDDRNTIVPCPLMYLCLSYDHRIVNGYHAVTYLGKVEELLSRAVDFPKGI